MLYIRKQTFKIRVLYLNIKENVHVFQTGFHMLCKYHMLNVNDSSTYRIQMSLS